MNDLLRILLGDTEAIRKSLEDYNEALKYVNENFSIEELGGIFIEAYAGTHELRKHYTGLGNHLGLFSMSNVGLIKTDLLLEPLNGDACPVPFASCVLVSGAKAVPYIFDAILEVINDRKSKGFNDSNEHLDEIEEFRDLLIRYRHACIDEVPINAAATFIIESSKYERNKTDLKALTDNYFTAYKVLSGVSNKHDVPLDKLLLNRAISNVKQQTDLDVNYLLSLVRTELK